MITKVEIKNISELKDRIIKIKKTLLAADMEIQNLARYINDAEIRIVDDTADFTGLTIENTDDD